MYCEKGRNPRGLKSKSETRYSIAATFSFQLFYSNGEAQRNGCNTVTFTWLFSADIRLPDRHVLEDGAASINNRHDVITQKT
jgi:hypothetical protein